MAVYTAVLPNAVMCDSLQVSTLAAERPEGTAKLLDEPGLTRKTTEDTSISGQISHELSSLRMDLANHNMQLLAMVTQRLEALASNATGLNSSGTNKFADAKVPQKFEVTSTNGSAPCIGSYVLVQGLTMNSYPVWKQADGPHWMFSMANGKWGIGEFGAGALNEGASIACSQPHFGTMPNEMLCAWKRVGWENGLGLSSTTGSQKSGTWGDLKVTVASSAPKEDFTFPDQISERPGSAAPTAVSSMPGSPSSTRRKKSNIINWAKEKGTHSMTWVEKSTSNVDKKKPGRKSRAMFGDTEQSKEQIHKNMFKEIYRVENRYSTEGRAQAIARHQWFEYLTLAVICFNALWIGYDADQNSADTLPEADVGFQIMENIFCIYFTFEITVRFLAFQRKLEVFRDMQFCFDSVLVSVMILETWFIYLIAVASSDGKANLGGGGAASLLRMLRLTRVLRVARLLRAVPQLMVLIKGIQAAATPVAWTLFFLLIIIYVFAVAFKNLTQNEPKVACTDDNFRIGPCYFKSIPDGMASLLLPGLMPDSADFVYNLGAEDFLFAMLGMAFIVIGTITVMNMLVGVLVEVVSQVSKQEIEEINAMFVRSELKGLVERELDTDGSGTLSKHEVASLLLNPTAAKVIAEIGVDVPGLVDVAEFHFFNQREEIGFDDFLELVLQLRGGAGLCVRDMVNLRKFIMEELAHSEERVIDMVVRHRQKAQGTEAASLDSLQTIGSIA